jgi:hypothetical protein
MSGKVSPASSVSSVAARRRLRGAAIDPARAIEHVDGTLAQDMRLIVEEAGDTGQVIYTGVDRRTGRVISRHTSEDLQRMSQDADYAPGEVFDAKA